MNPTTHPASKITPAELRDWLAGGKPFLLLDVMDEECYAQGHIEGASRACVYEMAFVDQVRALAPEAGATVAVYGTSERSQASKVAADKLRAAGYEHVHDLRGGLEAWIAAGHTACSDRAADKPPAWSGTFILDVEKSVVRWLGRNLLNRHEGTVKFESGKIVLRDGALTSAEFAVDMRTIACADLTDASLNAMLIRHLMDADFFEVAKCPLATFTATSAPAITGATPGTPNVEITGNLTLRGQTHELRFPAVVGLPDHDSLAAQTGFDLDRTRWGALYGSGRFFERLGKHLVNDLIHLDLKIVANKTSGSVS